MVDALPSLGFVRQRPTALDAPRHSAATGGSAADPAKTAAAEGGSMRPTDEAIARFQAERKQLLAECYGLLREIARHRYSLKLLHTTRRALQMIAKYKK